MCLSQNITLKKAEFMLHALGGLGIKSQPEDQIL
jgi:hypothetical protein